jgi:hypothetical protein
MQQVTAGGRLTIPITHANFFLHGFIILGLILEQEAEHLESRFRAFLLSPHANEAMLA